MDLINLSILVLIIALIYLFWRYLKLKDEMEKRALELFKEWKDIELKKEVDEKANLLFEEWKQKEEKNIRKDAIKRSEAIVRGKITENLFLIFQSLTTIRKMQNLSEVLWIL